MDGSSGNFGQCFTMAIYVNVLFSISFSNYLYDTSMVAGVVIFVRC